MALRKISIQAGGSRYTWSIALLAHTLFISGTPQLVDDKNLDHLLFLEFQFVPEQSALKPSPNALYSSFPLTSRFPARWVVRFRTPLRPLLVLLL